MLSWANWLRRLTRSNRRLRRAARGAAANRGAPVTWAAPNVEALEERIVFATRVWTGAVDANWMTPGNWVGGVAPQADDNLLFPAGVTGSALTSTNDFPDGTRFR